MEIPHYSEAYGPWTLIYLFNIYRKKIKLQFKKIRKNFKINLTGHHVYVNRELETVFTKAITAFRVIAVVGPRQSGKTTFLRKMLEKHGGNYVSLDDPDARELFDRDIKQFEIQYLRENIPNGLDEVQYGKNAGLKLKYLADKGYSLWVTSSSEIFLSADVLSYLVGRVCILRLYPFSFREFLRAKGIVSNSETIIRRALWEHMQYGGFPGVVLSNDTEVKRLILVNLLETMVLRDIVRNFSISDINSLQRVITFLAHSGSQLLSMDDISRSLDLSFQTVRKYIDAIQKAYIIFLAKPYFTNKLKELSKRPKVFFIDTGMRVMITGEKESSGPLLENYIATELLKMGFAPKFWMSKSKAEVDVVIETVNGPVPVEIKKSKYIRVPRSLLAFIRRYHPPVAYVVQYESPCVKTIIVEGTKIVYTSIPDFFSHAAKMEAALLR